MSGSDGSDFNTLVFDVGSHTFRAGYAHYESPQFDIPAVVGVGEMDDDSLKLEYSNITSKQKYYIGTQSLRIPREGVDVCTYMKDGMIENWDLFEQMLDFTYSSCFQTESKCHPVLITEPPSNLGQKREQLIELMFEKYDVPAFFLSKNAVLATYATGRVSGLVIDSGATHTTAVAIRDGYVLSNNAIINSPLAGDYITVQCKQFLQESNIDIIPPYMLDGIKRVKSKEPANWTKETKLPEVSSSWHEYMVDEVIKNFKHDVLKISDIPFNENSDSTSPQLCYEFPNGYKLNLGVDRFRIPEVLFNPPSDLGESMLDVSSVVTRCIRACDISVRPLLYNNIILAGGNSCMQGFYERLNKDLSLRIPSSMKLKCVSVPAKYRRLNAWIGGSIASSLEGINKFFITRQDYQENGESVVRTRCP